MKIDYTNLSFTQLIDKIETNRFFDLPRMAREAFRRLLTRVEALEDSPSGGGYEPPYKVYTALINQSGTNAPVSTVIYNDTGSTFTWNYDDVGSYIATSSSPILLSNKTVVFVTAQGNSGNNQNKIFGGTRYNDTSIGLFTSSDGILKLNFEIRVYN